MWLSVLLRRMIIDWLTLARKETGWPKNYYNLINQKAREAELSLIQYAEKIKEEIAELRLEKEQVMK